MDYEKKYNEALERAKLYHRNELAGTRQEMTEYIFPELRESEDERIRKALIQFFTEIKDIAESGRNSWAVRKEDAEMCAGFLAYLEKQKPAEWSEEDKRAINDGIVALSELAYGSVPNILPSIMIESAKRLQSLRPQPKQEWSEEDEYLLGETIQHLEELIRIDKAKHCGVDVQYYQRDIDWLKSLPERFNLQPKQEWSEEEEGLVSLTIAAVEDFYDKSNPIRSKIINFLKSLRPSWKPSEEQMEALKDAIIYVESSESNFKGSGFLLESLFNNLQKL